MNKYDWSFDTKNQLTILSSSKNYITKLEINILDFDTMNIFFIKS